MVETTVSTVLGTEITGIVVMLVRIVVFVSVKGTIFVVDPEVTVFDVMGHVVVVMKTVLEVDDAGVDSVLVFTMVVLE